VAARREITNDVWLKLQGTLMVSKNEQSPGLNDPGFVHEIAEQEGLNLNYIRGSDMVTSIAHSS
jgi:hypothetical protein